MAITEPSAHVKSDKGLQANSLGLVGNIVIGLASVAPAYSLAATLGFVVVAVGEKAPSMFALAFIPMLLVAFAYRELSRDTPDCGTTLYACVWYFRGSLFESARNLFMRGIFPLLGALAMTWAFVRSAVDMIKPDYGYTAYGSIGGVFVVGVGMLALGVPLMLLCFAFGTKRFFRGETLTPETEVKVPDIF